LHELQSLGISVVLDGFGTGGSSLGHLRMFAFDKIKIDRSFVADMIERAASAAIVHAVTGLARGLDMMTSADGIETEAQFRMLEAAGCDQGQGAWFGEPGPVAEATALVLSGTPLRKSA
jgi:EAL domain-containing protein (putative c-di-GMP-specific phosphodiesterase class I)